MLISCFSVQNTKDKEYFCVYCKSLVRRFAEHLLKHSNSEVNRIKTLLKSNPARKKAIAAIRRKGTLQYNLSVGIKTNTLICARRTKNKGSNKVPCSNCGEFMTRPKGHQDEVMDTIRSDELIIEYRIFLASSNVHKPKRSTYNSIRSKLRSLALILKEMKRLDPTIKDLSSIYAINKLHTFEEAIKKLSNFQDKASYGKPSWAINSGYAFKTCGELLHLFCLKDEDDVAEMRVDGWLSYYKTKYHVPPNYGQAGQSRCKGQTAEQTRKTTFR